MQITILFVPLHSLLKGKHIGELAEWSNAAVLKTVDLNGSGGSNPSLSAKKWLTGICEPLFNFSIPKNIPKSLRKSNFSCRKLQVALIVCELEEDWRSVGENRKQNDNLLIWILRLSETDCTKMNHRTLKLYSVSSLKDFCKKKFYNILIIRNKARMFERRIYLEMKLSISIFTLSKTIIT